MANNSLTIHTNRFFALVLKSPLQMGWLSIINSVTNISRLGTFNTYRTVPRHRFKNFNISWIFLMDVKILKPKSIKLPIALEVGRHKAEAMLLLFKVRQSNEKIWQSASVTRPLKLRKSVQPILEQNELSSCISTIRISVRGIRILADLSSHRYRQIT
jgi:hypothetical protein